MIFSTQNLPAPLDWSALFARAAPVEADLGCGKGRFLLAHAAAHPDTSFVGTDLQFGRLAKIRARAERRGLANIRLLHVETRYALEYLFPADSLAAIYLFFPDPWPKRKHQRRRLVQPAWMNHVHRVLAPGAALHLATDHADYFAHMEKVVRADPRFTRIAPFLPPDEEKTDFEVLFTGKGLPVFRHSCRKTG